MTTQTQPRYVLFSLFCHVLVLLILIFSVNFSTPLPVFENTNKNDVISVVILGDSPQSRILREETAAPPQEIKKEKPLAQKKPPVVIKKEVIPLKIDVKKIAEQKAIEKKQQQDIFAKELLADIKKHKEKKRIKQQQLQSHFKKTLREQAEKTLREELLDEEILLQGKQSRQSHGEINKYKALILQAISKHWLVPAQANKSLNCELMIRVAPGGAVLDVQITKTSGDPSLDNSARAAVLKASPLPVPRNKESFQAFSQFVLKVKPENITTSV